MPSFRAVNGTNFLHAPQQLRIAAPNYPFCYRLEGTLSIGEPTIQSKRIGMTCANKMLICLLSFLLLILSYETRCLYNCMSRY